MLLQCVCVSDGAGAGGIRTKEALYMGLKMEMDIQDSEEALYMGLKMEMDIQIIRHRYPLKLVIWILNRHIRIRF